MMIQCTAYTSGASQGDPACLPTIDPEHITDNWSPVFGPFGLFSGAGWENCLKI